MKKITLFSLLLTTFGGFAQSTVQDTINMGANYANEVFYKLNNNQKSAVAASSWNIGFETATMSATVFSNPANTKVYRYPNGTNAAFASVDTTGLSTWPQLYNGIGDYSGAFNQGITNGFDYGWGSYNMTTHQVVGDSLYVILVGTNAYVLDIVNRVSGTYNLKFAPLSDLANPTTLAINGTQYQNKNFVFFNLATGAVVDNELEGFDLWFRKFHGLYGSYSVQTVTGILTAPGLEVAAVTVGSGDQASHNDYQAGTYSTDNNVIGDKWKSVSYTTFQWSVTDTTVYYVKKENGDIFKLFPTGFTGNSTGTAYFTIEQIAFAGVENASNTLLDVYPNPATQIVNVVLDAKSDITINVRNQMGQTVLVETVTGQAGLTTKQVNIEALTAGMYFVEVVQNGQSVVKQLVKQ